MYISFGRTYYTLNENLELFYGEDSKGIKLLWV